MPSLRQTCKQVLIYLANVNLQFVRLFVFSVDGSHYAESASRHGWRGFPFRQSVRARMAESRPEPGPFTLTSSERMPASRARYAAVTAACCAAKGEPFREPLNPSEPALDQQTTLPSWSVIVPVSIVERRLDVRHAGRHDLLFLLLCSPFSSVEPYQFYRLSLSRCFLFTEIAPRRGPLRVRALVWVRWPRTGKPRRCRSPR